MEHATDSLQSRWLKLNNLIKEQFNIQPDLEGILMLIGVQELGQGPQKFNKEQKQDLMHIAVCTILSTSGYYKMDGKDKDGWPLFTQLKPTPPYGSEEQENFIKDHILMYFQRIGFIS